MDKPIIINHPCRIDPYKGKSLEIIRNGNKIFTTDGRVIVGDIIAIEERLADKMVNTIFGDKTLASYLGENKEETEEEVQEENNTENTNEEAEEETTQEENTGEETKEDREEDLEDSEEPEDNKPEEENEVDLSDMTVNELKAYASENDITIPSSIKSKADIIEYIENQLKNKTSEEEE